MTEKITISKTASCLLEKIKKSYTLFFLLSFFIPIFVMLIICKTNSMYPFGSKSWLICDMDNQYISYFSYFKTAVKENGFFYTFSKTMGGDMLGFSAYYLMSPLNFLFFLVPAKGIPDMAAWISLIKLGLCGLSFYTLSSYKGRKFSNVIFSTAYALSAYNLFYLSNIMWFDAIYMLPLVVLGIRKIIDKNKPFLYIVTLLYTLLTNYYIGYMVCIFCVLYYLYSIFCVHHGTIREKLRRTLSFCTASLLAGGMTMWLLLPTKYSLEGVKAPFRLSSLTADTNFYWNDVFVKFLHGSHETLMAGMPNLFCGMLILFFAGVFFLSRQIPFKKKIGQAVLFVLFYFSFWISGLNLAWHGFNTPIGFPCRYSFLCCFLLICTAQEGFHQMHTMRTKNLCVAALLSLSAITGIIFLMYKKQFSFMENKDYWISLCFAASAAAVLFLSRCRLRRTASLVGFFLIAVELYLNGNSIYKDMESTATTYFDLYTDLAEEDCKLVAAIDSGFYRMEKNFFRTMNDPMLFHYAGLSHYSSTDSAAVKRFMGLLGFRDNGNWAYYNRGSTLSAESFLGVKYLLSRTKLPVPYLFVDKIDGTYIYENPYAFSMAFLTDGCAGVPDADTDSPFAFQNSLFETLWWEGGDMFILQPDVTLTLHNVYALDDAGNYLKADEGAEGYLEYSFTLMHDFPLYLYFNTDDMHVARIYVDGVDTGKYFDNKQYDILCVSDYTPAGAGDTVTVRVVLEQSSINITQALFCYEDPSVLQAYYAYQAAGAVTLQKLSDSHFVGSFDNTENRGEILFSIPFDEGWQVYIDKKKQDTAQSMGIFLSVSDVPAGSHTIELKYVPKGFLAGSLISLFCLAAFLGWLIYRLKKQQDAAACKRTVIIALTAACVALCYPAVCLSADKIRENKAKTVKTAANEAGQGTLFLGSMPQNQGGTDAKPIEWIILDIQDGKALIVSKYALACLPYSNGDATATWDNSFLRQWLNQDFYDTVFTKEEKDQILSTQLDNGRNATPYIDAGEDTCDKVFILDRYDIQTYFGVNAYLEENKFYSENAICSAVSAAAPPAGYYTLDQNQYENFYAYYNYSEQVVGSSGCWYWLRNPGLYTSGNALLVGGNGNVFDLGGFVTESNFVRPAMWIVYEEKFP